MDCINATYNTKITSFKLFYHPQLFKDGDKANFFLKCKNKEGKAVNFQEVTVNGVKIQNLNQNFNKVMKMMKTWKHEEKLKWINNRNKIITMMEKWDIEIKLFEFKLNIADFCYENDIEYF